MQYELVESKTNNSQITYDFSGFDDWISINKIVNIIRGSIKPSRIALKGGVNVNGYFEKDGLYVEIHHDETKGNYLEFKGEISNENLNKTRVWARTIFNRLMFTNIEENN